MSLSHWQRSAIVLPILLTSFLLLAGCGGSTSQTPAHTVVPTPTPTPGQGQQLLNGMATTINTARTLHGLFNLTISGQAINGTVNTEIWNASGNKSHVDVPQSTIPQLAQGSVIVTDGKQQWQYDPQKNVVYNGPLPQSATGDSGSNLGGKGGGQSQFLLNIIQTIFSHSTGTQRSDTTVDGQNVYDVHVVPQKTENANDASTGNFNYTGEVYIAKTTHLPIQVNLDLQGLGTLLVDIPKLDINPDLPETTFTYTVPAGVKVLPLQDANTGADGSGTLNLAQAQQLAGYHLLSIPGEQADYILKNVTALGAPGNQTYSLNYAKGNLTFTLVESKTLANLSGSAGQKVSLRGTSGTITKNGDNSTLSWTEKEVGIQITGALTKDQLVEIANLLS
ncbi:outer membrane lipoprotein-sorting protein [Tengunoibacter tsumagoiensis]|uniref:DUF4367 domain-containing protein n=1 Tax=Tengunoibacter tsumagoiensis TaxID=2014871 RepID=A0A401ZVQ3_9CHLR|nr:DUF4367 domain-containing protein [Tengunoibacter tsumagoiensis]GCE10927.1 hypothetical protein KTT_07860 [Tengunoibacter tsumagoiensis]